MSEQMTQEELRDAIDDCRRRILAEFGIEWKPEEKHADQRRAAHVPVA
jgi:hypothetical protein